jgi:glycosyltransferase involved in cell wall biosynthesis
VAPELSVVIPAYNEAEAVRSGKVRSVLDWLATQPFESEVLVIDDGSSDATAALAAAAGARVVSIPHKGKASALMAGISAAHGQWLLFSDMDQATPISDAPRLLAHRADAECIIGSRGLVRPGAPPGRYLLSGGHVILRRLLTGLKITDTQCGFKLIAAEPARRVVAALYVYAPDAARVLKTPSVTSGFDVEFLFVAKRLGYRISEVPVTWDYQQTRRVNLVRDAFRGLWDLLRLRLHQLRGRYPAAQRADTATAPAGKSTPTGTAPS